MEIKNIILDLGGVLLNIDYLLTINAFKKLGVKNFDELYSQANQNELFNDFEKGSIKADQFIDGIAQYLPKTTSKQAITEAWNAMLLDFPKERLGYLMQLKEHYHIVLLSNTNTLHLDFFHTQLNEVYGIKSLDAYFEHTYFSCDMGMRKPNPEIFRQVCKNEGFNPEETLFIDDTAQHVEGAKKAGLNAYHLEVKSNNLIKLLDTLLT
jgi:putative hydrolase of the HAD superfamily